uniref:Uncharacterized protein n=1 Tax=Eutreptiella gymnastica TaxID=73025 RepID=A0A7S1HZ36_9EUGL|mmetsp:Transcript_116300/g.202217  ORF Transcript_116300/g.202217 Transcript_116300/m.202217 type:complete len:347 (+) Transcript_116300:128-1168(+)
MAEPTLLLLVLLLTSTLLNIFANPHNAHVKLEFVKKQLTATWNSNTTQIVNIGQYYRLGDIIRMGPEYVGMYYGIDGEALKTLYRKRYPDSIATRYMDATNETEDYDTLAKIVKDYRPEIQPEPYALYVHLRLGDVVENSTYTVLQHWASFFPFRGKRFWTNESWAYVYVKPKRYFIRYMEYNKSKVIRLTHRLVGPRGMKKMPCTGKVVILAGHGGRRSGVYKKLVQNLFLASGCEVSLRLAQPVDEDFLLLLRARWYLPTGGGFGRCVQYLRRIFYGEKPHYAGPYYLGVLYVENKERCKNSKHPQICLQMIREYINDSPKGMPGGPEVSSRGWGHSSQELDAV